MVYSKDFLENVKRILSDLLENPKKWMEYVGICFYLEDTYLQQYGKPKTNCRDFVDLFLEKYGYDRNDYIPESTESFGSLRQEFARNIIKDIDAGNIPS